MVIDEGRVTKLEVAVRLCANARRFLEHPGGSGLIEKALVLTFLGTMEKALEAIAAEVPPVPAPVKLVDCDMENGYGRGFRSDNGGYI